MSDRFVTVARYYDMIEPQIAKGVLEQHGLLCHLIGENQVRAVSQAIIGLGGIQLRVLESGANTASDRGSTARIHGGLPHVRRA